MILDAAVWYWQNTQPSYTMLRSSYTSHILVITEPLQFYRSQPKHSIGFKYCLDPARFYRTVLSNINVLDSSLKIFLYKILLHFSRLSSYKAFFPNEPQFKMIGLSWKFSPSTWHVRCSCKTIQSVWEGFRFLIKVTSRETRDDKFPWKLFLIN